MGRGRPLTARSARIASLGTGIPALLMLLVGLYFTLPVMGLLSSGRSAEGVVVGQDRSASSRGSRPVVTFVAEGRTVTLTGGVSSSPPAFSTGEHVRVLYKPEAPEEGRIDSFLELWFLPVMFGGFGLLMLPVCIAFLVIHRRLRKREERMAAAPLLE